MLNRVINDAIKIGIPVNDTIERKVYVDKGTIERAGFCNWCFTKYEIHITDKLLNAKENYILDVLAHEVLHTCFLAKTHHYPWSYYAEIMNKTYGYNIKENYNGWKEVGIVL